MLQYLAAFHRDLHARFVKYFRTREVVTVLARAHSIELAETPGEMWPTVREKHLAQIAAVRDGNLDIIDRRSWAFPYLPEALHRLNQPILKNTPYNLRRFSETPIPRRAINLIKNAVLSLRWDIRPMPDVDGEDPDVLKRVKICKGNLLRPNNVDSWRTLMEAVIEDYIIGGYGCIEPRVTPDIKRPFKLWPVDGSTIRIFADWTESVPDKPRFAQMTGLKGERGIVAFRADELIYIKHNCRSNTPFGLGMLETAFNSVNAFLGAQDMAAKAGADQVHKTWLWWKTPQVPHQVQTVRRHIQNELEGQQKVSLMAGMPKPEVLEVTPVTPQDLLLDWQEFLIRIIANAFDLSPLALGLERDVNRATGEVMATSDFRQAVVPTARKFEEAFTRELLHGIMQWKDLQFVFIGLEDPDTQTKTQIQQRHWMMNAILPDEIREDAGRPPLPGGWGRLTFSQYAILQQEAAARLSIRTQKAAQQGMPGLPGGGGPGFPGLGEGMDLGEVFSARDVAAMEPGDVERNQSLGLLPQSPSKLKKQMEEEEPGILEVLSDDLKDFFDKQEELEDESALKPAEVTSKDEKEQKEKFHEAERSPSLIEQAYMDRGKQKELRRGTAPQKQPGARGRYPRSGSEMRQ